LAILGKVQVITGVEVLPLPTVPKIKHLMLSSVLISVIGFVESFAVSKTYATKNDYVIYPNRELVAMGACNIISSLFGCYPAFGSLGRSSLNSTAGAKTQLAGFFTVS
jgi:SulP family sulfate permease